MRIAVVTPRTHHHEHTRRSTRLAGITSGLQHAGHEVSIITTRWWGQRHLAHHGRYTTHCFGGEGSLTGRSVARRLFDLDVDIIHLVDVHPAIVRAAGVVGRLRRTPIVYEANDFETPLMSNALLHRRARRRIDRVIAPSGVVETMILEAGVRAPIDRIPDPVDIDRVAGTVPDSRADIIWAAQGAGASEVDLVLLGLAELRDHQWRGALLGPMDDPSAVHTAVDDLGLSDRVQIIDDITPRERIAIYRGGRVFIQTAAVCPFPTELMLAMAAGCVGVVQYQEYSSAHELVERTRHGELISTPEQIASAIKRAAQREANTFDASYQNFEPEMVAKQLVESYQAALS